MPRNAEILKGVRTPEAFGRTPAASLMRVAGARIEVIGNQLKQFSRIKIVKCSRIITVVAFLM